MSADEAATGTAETADTQDAVGEEWFCDQCGRRYPAPGTCAVGHPETQLKKVADQPVDETAAEDSSGSDETQTATSDAAAGAEAEAVHPSDTVSPPPPADDQAAEKSGLLDEAKQLLAKAGELLTRL